MGLRTRLYARRAQQWCGAVVSTTGTAVKGFTSLMTDIYYMYLSGVVRSIAQNVTSEESKKCWNKWMTRLGFRRRVVIRKRKRNANHLTNLENELEQLKQQMALLSGQLNPPTASSSGWPTSGHPNHPDQLPHHLQRQGRARTQPPPPPARKRGGRHEAPATAQPRRLRAVGAAPVEDQFC
eukprot:TRINITY_DN34251_c0_g1_i1.p1 TRINITY_DN34251_c0_g1~~TRINITY_DN34251_c0_g1_i1.p1  ORF type:complete len:191 (+),score=18.54 TRINITY_DN34251_c0_g1_i1:33-575(+)